MGRLQAEALELIRNSNLTAGTLRERQSSQTTGMVMEQRPAAGTPVPRGTPIDLVVAIPVPIRLVTVPDLVGQRPENVSALLGDSLRIGTIATKESSAPAGVILDQTPAAGQSVTPGSVVNISLAIPATPVEIAVPAAPIVQPVPPPPDPPAPTPIVQPATPQPILIVVPRLVEGSLAQALGTIRAAGLQPGTVTQTPSAIAAGIVTFQTPAAGIQVVPGTPVDLIVSVPLAEAETSEVPLIWLSAGLFTGLIAAAAAASLSRARRNRLAGTPSLVPHADEGQQTSEPGDASLIEFKLTLDAHADPGVQTLEEKQVMSW